MLRLAGRESAGTASTYRQAYSAPMSAAHDSPAPPQVLGDSPLQTAVLEDLSAAVRYREWLAGLAAPWLGPEPLEVGSGLGDYAATWAAWGHRVTASEADPSRLAALRDRFAGSPGISVRELAVPVAETGRYSAVVAINVLEHIEDDAAALRALAGLAPGGRVILLVPAFPLLYSRFDRQVGHVRRYRRAALRAVLEAACLEVQRLHHVNAVGFLSWLVVVRLLGARPHDGLALRLFDRMVPALARIEAWRPPPFGQSLFAVARVPGTDTAGAPTASD